MKDQLNRIFRPWAVGLGLVAGLFLAFASASVPPVQTIEYVDPVKPWVSTSPIMSTPAVPSVPSGMGGQKLPYVPKSGGIPSFAGRQIGEAPPVPVGTGIPDSSGEPPLAPPLPGPADLAVCLTSERVWGVVGAEETVTVSVNGAQMGADRADQIGFFWTTLYGADGNRPGLGAGDMVRIYHDGTLSASVTLRAITATVDVGSNVVSGTIGGGGFPISVTVYYAGSGEPAMVSYSKTVNTDGFGNFSADFTGVWDIIADDPMVVGYVENGVEVHRHVYAARIVVLHPPISGVNGWTAPGLIVTATVYSTTGIRSQEVGTADATGRYGWLWMDMEEGDTVVVELADGTVMSRTVDVLSENIDPASDRITGMAAPGAIVRGVVDTLTPLGWQRVQSSTIAIGGAYTIEFGSLADFMPGQWAGIHVADAEGDDLALWAPTPYVDVNQTYNQVYGYGPSSLGRDSDGRAVTLTLASTTTVYATTMDEWAWYSFDQNNGLPDIAPGDVVTVEIEGYDWQGAVQVMTITVDYDANLDRFTGEVETPTERVELSGHYYQPQLYPVGGQFDMLVTASSPFTATPSGFDVNGDLYYDVVHRTAGDYVERISRQTDGIGEVINANGVGGVFNPPGVAYTITLYNSGGQVKTQVTGNSGEPTGGFWINLWDYGQEQIEVGDYLQGQSAAGFTYTVEIPTLTIHGDPATDVVFGEGPANAQVRVEVGEGSPPPYQGYVSTDASGRFTVTLGQLQQAWGNGDLQWGDRLTVVYYDEKNTWLVAQFAWPQITARTTMEGGNAVFGYNAIPGNTIYITVTDPGANVVATGTTSMGTCDWCDYWLDLPSGTLTPNNTVTVDFGDGFVDSMTVLTLTAEANPDSDVVTATAPAGTHVSVYMDGPNGGWDWGWSHPTLEVGSEGYVVFDVSGEYDIVYGTVFYVHTYQAHGHQTEYEFWLPAPDVGVWKGTVSGFARPGGKYVYQIVYWNDGNGVATDVILVDTLPLSTTYAGDTSGVTPEISADGSVITWNLGTLPPPGNNDNWGVFVVTLDVSDTVPSGSGNLPANCVTISTSAPGDTNPGNESSCTGPVDVWESDVGVNIDKWPNPNDPTPGQEFEYTIRWCAERGANFGPVWLTDTLPISTTVVDWWADEWPRDNLWSEVSTTGGQFVLYAPGLPGNWCQHVHLRLFLDPDAPPGTVLQNSVVITTPGDVDPGNDQEINTDAHVGPPRYDMNTDKWFGGGVLVPGGWIRYGASWWNAGNTAVHAWLTDTLPPGTSYQPGSGWHHDGYPFEPVTVTDEYVVWDLGEVGVSQGRGLDFGLDIGSGVTPGTVLTNCAAVGIAEAEDTPWTNTDCVTETVNEPGPNLRVRKWSWWEGDNQLHYHVQFENIGDEQINNVWITDTLPEATTWDGWWDLQFDWSRLSTQDLGPNMLRWQFSTLYPGDSGGIEFRARLDDPNTRPAWYTNTVEIAPSDDYPDDNTAVTVDVKGEVERVEMWVASEGDNMWGRVQPNAPITITTALAQYTSTANEWGDWNIDGVEALDPGATITVTAGAGILPVVVIIPDPFTAYASSITDTVWGQIDALDHEQIRVELYGYGGKGAWTDDSGNYRVTWADVPRGGEGHVHYETTMDYAQVVMHRRFHTPDLALNVNYGHDWVEGNYETGHTVWLTVTQADGVTIKATAELTTGVIPWWGGRTGFSTNLGEPWQPQRPDIETGDWVYGSLDGVYTSSVRVGTITGAVDANADTVSGTITADWFTQMLNAQCGVWERDAPNYHFTVAPDGGSYLCDFSADWDLLPGQTVHVDYQEPDGDWVLNAFQEPTPHLRIQTWADGNPAEGGNFTFHIQYQNGGGADAEDVVITGTLQGASYITDTSGFPHTGGGSGPIVWELGTVAPGDWVRFDVFVQITAVESETLAYAVQIATSNPYDQGNPAEKYSDWSGHVVANDTRLSVGKGAWTGDPAPGYDMVFSVNICNHSGTASSQVTLTDTLHPSLTLQTWWGQYAGWQEVSRDDHHLVVTHPSIPGWWCSEVYVRAHLDENAWQGMPISNTAVIASANDLSTGDDETTWWGGVGSPHTNLYLNSQMEWGRLVPGGEIAYGIHYQNTGNVPVDNVRITVTLPTSTTFNRSWYWTPQGEQPVAPALVTADYVVWDLGTLDNGYGWNMNVALAVDSRAPVGTVLTSTATISPQPREDRYDDNSSTVVEVLHEFGPNLRVSKYYQWEHQGRLRYGIFIRNLGTTRMENIWITDTYPLSTTSDGNFWVGHGPRYTYTLDAPNRQFVVWAESLDPGNTGHFGFWVDLDGSLHGVEGLAFTNTVAAPWPGDVYPADNTDVEISYTGPDVYIEKWLSGGVPKPGAIVTFTVVFGNRNQWPWDGDPAYGSHITDTLPPEMTFVNANAPWDPSQSWMPTELPGNVLVWGWGTMWNNSRWTFDVAVRITDTVEGGDVLTNVIAAYGDSPDDVEPFYDNNVFALPVTILNPRFEIGKVYESTRVAGTPVTYTLTVTNVGNEIATGVIVSDALPAYLEDVESDGTLSFGWLWWRLGPIAPDGGVDTAEFRATLPCTAGLSIVNADYGVRWSDQGVSGPAGASVSFDVIEPSISAAFTHTPDAIVAGDTVYFTATASTDGTPLTYEWDFGDGLPVIGGLTASHVYTRAGVYTAIFTATDVCGYSATATTTVTVRAPALDADFVTFPSSASILVGDTVLFTDTSTTDGPPIVAWAWDFGDGGASTAQHPTHTYTSPGVFTVTLVVTDALGYSDVEVKPNVVAVSLGCIPVTDVSFTYVPAQPFIRSPVSFTAAYLPADATQPISYTWSFGDGTLGDGMVVTHTYPLSDSYTVVVTTTNCAGSGRASHSETVRVVLLEGDQESVEPDVGGRLVYTDTQGNPTIVEIPGSAVTQTVTLLLTPLPTMTHPISPTLRFANHAFDLEVYLNYVLQPGFVFLQPLTITIHYSESDVAGLDEDTLKLYYWSGTGWEDAANTCTPPSTYVRDSLRNVLSVQVCHLSRFGVMGVSVRRVYLPVVLRN